MGHLPNPEIMHLSLVSNGTNESFLSISSLSLNLLSASFHMFFSVLHSSSLKLIHSLVLLMSRSSHPMDLCLLSPIRNLYCLFQNSFPWILHHPWNTYNTHCGFQFTCLVQLLGSRSIALQALTVRPSSPQIQVHHFGTTTHH